MKDKGETMMKGKETRKGRTGGRGWWKFKEQIKGSSKRIENKSEENEGIEKGRSKLMRK